MNVSSLQPPVQVSKLPLTQLAGNANVSDKQKIEEVSRQFEAILVRQILAQGQKNSFPSSYVSTGAASGIYQDMVNNQMADRISESGSLGIAKMLNQQLSHDHLKDRPSTLMAASASAGLPFEPRKFELRNE